jgi:hypothetical protein
VSPRAIIAAVLAVLAAALIVVGTFLPSAEMHHLSDGKLDETTTVTSWHRTLDPAPEGTLAQYYSASHVPIYGIPLAVVGAALLAAAVVALVTARRTSGAARTTMTAAAAAAVVAAFMLAMDVQSTLSYEGADPSDTPASKSTYDIGLGFWLVAGGAVLALVATGLMLVRTRPFPDDTPPQGFPAPLPVQYQRPPYRPQYPPPYPQQPAQPPPPVQQPAPPQQPPSPPEQPE